MKKKRHKLHLAESDKMLVDLQSIIDKGLPEREKARSFIQWWFANKYWTQSQWMYVKHLVHRSKKPKKQEVERKYQIYAISDSTALKIGFSSDIRKRIKQMQTGHPAKLELLWKLYVGTEREYAVKVEKMIHRLCEKERIRGEWFKLSAAKKLQEFRLKPTQSENSELEIVLAANERI